MKKTDQNTTLQELKDKVVTFRDKRNWKKHHSAKNLAISICLEAAELLEHYQWDDYTAKDKQQLADELADVFFNLLNFADVTDIDISQAFLEKFKRVEKKYPVELFNKDRDSSSDYNRIKRQYRQNKK